jgi:hypothetical protein
MSIKSWNWQLAKKYIVRLTEEERTDLESLIHKGIESEANKATWKQMY